MKKVKFKIKKTTNFFWYIFLGVFMILVAIIIAPFWAKINDANIPWASWGMIIFLFLIAASLLVYVFKVLVYKLKVKKQHKVVKILTSVEFSIMLLVVVLCILFGLTKIGIMDFNIPEALSDHLGTLIVGFAIWSRGFVEIFGAYYYDKNDKNLKEYPVWYLLINIGLLSIGPMFIFNDDITDSILLYVFASLILVGGILAIIYGCLSKPVITETPVENDSPEINQPSNKPSDINPSNSIPHENNKQIENQRIEQIENKEVKQIESNNNSNNDDITVG